MQLIPILRAHKFPIETKLCHQNPPLLGSRPLKKHTFNSLMRRLSQAGFKTDFVRPALLPDWWDKACAEDPALLPDVEIRVARFLRLTLSAVQDPTIPLAPPHYEGAHLRRVRELDPSRLAPSIHTAIQVASAVVRSLRSSMPPPTPLPADGLLWREQIQHGADRAIGLSDLLGDLWERGIPVVPLDILPTPNFQGLACMVEGRPVVLLGHKHDEPGRVAFFIAHEVGHIANRDCSPDNPIIDGEEEVSDDTPMERAADHYAMCVLVEDRVLPIVNANNYRELATRAGEIERADRIDAGAVIFAWARRTGNYQLAVMAVKALYRAVGARRLLRTHFDRHVDLDSATESDRALLHCVFGDPECDATSR